MFRKSDLFLAAALFICSLSVFVFLPFGNEAGAAAVITANGQTVGIMDLSVPEVQTFETEGAGFNMVEVKNGQISVIDADCPDRVCVRRGAVGLSGETVVCLPHRFVVEIRGGEASPVDAVTE